LDRRICHYITIIRSGIEITIATPLADNLQLIQSEDPSAATEDTKRFDKDAELQSKLKQ
jgi:hypothetical protein